MSEINDYSDLRDIEWKNIPEVDFLIKCKFLDKGYSILVTNLKEMFGENIYEDEVQQRFSDVNKHAKMKTNVIIRNLEKTLDLALAGNSSILKLDCLEESIRIQLQFIVNRASLSFNFEPSLLSLNQMRSHILVPTLSHALLTYQENIALKKKLSQLESKLKLESVSKDSMLDYKKNVNAFNLMINTNEPESVIIDVFLNVQKDIQACFNDRKKVVELHRSQLPEIPDTSRTPIKKEVSDPSLPITYDEDVEENTEHNSCPDQLQLPVKREISESSSSCLNEDGNITQPPSNLEKLKKKKSFKF